MSLFEKCYRFTKAREVMAAGYYPYFQPISESYDTEVIIRGEKKIMVGSNNYLGLTHHPKVIAAA
ncbi:MAG: 8-amino-7-oxononanoate synthase, partial [Gemmatimonadota bacterium]